MKKSWIVLFFVFLVLISFVNALDVEESIGKIEGFYDNLDDVAGNPNNYLKQEWTKIFERSSFGRIVLGFGEILSGL